MIKTTVYLVRHAEVENPANIVYGTLPGYKLSPHGKEQAKKLKAYFEGFEISEIFSSPLERAIETSEIISAGRIPITVEKDLIEADFKNWDLMTLDERSGDSAYQAYLRNPQSITYLGEDIDTVMRRITEKIEVLVRANQGRNIIVVSHGVPLVCAILHFTNRDYKSFYDIFVANASVTKLSFNDMIKCESINYEELSPAKKDFP